MRASSRPGSGYLTSIQADDVGADHSGFLHGAHFPGQNIQYAMAVFM
jgi:hypothetical protein